MFRHMVKCDALSVCKVGLFDFVVGTWNYCTEDKDSLSKLAFDIYDRDTTGTITKKELKGMFIDVWGAKW